MNSPKVSIITICYNSGRTIRDTVQSVLSQDYPDIEYIIIDGASTDDTLQVIGTFKNEKIKLYSEKDKGLYDALNKGLSKATGDIVGILHSDDFYAHTRVISDIVDLFAGHSNIQAVSSSVNIYKETNLDKPYRIYKASAFRSWQFKLGMQPPHPGFFIERSALMKVGNFDASYKISGDFDWLLRVIRIHRIKVLFTNYVSVHMRDGGVSSSGVNSKLLMNRENLRVLRSHGIYSNALFIYFKYFFKVFQLKI